MDNLSPPCRRRRWGGGPPGSFSPGVEGWKQRARSGASPPLRGPPQDRSIFLLTRIKALNLFGRLPELELVTERGVRFLSFSTTDGQPQCPVVDRRSGTAQWFTVREGRLHSGAGANLRFDPSVRILPISDGRLPTQSGQSDQILRCPSRATLPVDLGHLVAPAGLTCLGGAQYIGRASACGIP